MLLGVALNPFMVARSAAMSADVQPWKNAHGRPGFACRAGGSGVGLSGAAHQNHWFGEEAEASAGSQPLAEGPRCLVSWGEGLVGFSPLSSGEHDHAKSIHT